MDLGPQMPRLKIVDARAPWIPGAEPRSLASGDFDGDGAQDVAIGYETPDGHGVAVLRYGNPHALWPARGGSMGETRDETVVSPFTTRQGVVGLLAGPEWLFAGDFDADGDADLAVGRKGATEIWFHFGDGRGRFPRSREVELPGEMTALACADVNRRDGIADVVVGVDGAEGSQLLVFEGPNGGADATPEVFPARERIDAVAIGSLDGDVFADVAFAADRTIAVVRGRDRMLSLDTQSRESVAAAQVEEFEVPAPVGALAPFGASSAGGRRLAALSTDGTVRTFDGAREVSTVAGIAEARAMISARVSGAPDGDLLLPSAGGARLLQAGTGATLSLPPECDGVAVLAIRLNGDALDDLVVLGADGALRIALTSPRAVLVVTSSADSGPGTLRQAMLDANATQAADTIIFSVATGRVTIQPTSPLPILTAPVTIDGTTQPGVTGGPGVELAGQSAGKTGGIFVRATGVRVRGLSIGHFDGSGIVVDGGGGHVFDGNYIGLGADGESVRPNAGSGIYLLDTADVLVGGTTPAARNVIGANEGNGVEVEGAGSRDCRVEGNYIGLDATGSRARGNRFQGVVSIGALDLVVGGTAPGARNVISANGLRGVLATGATRGLVVQQNFLGTGASGMAALGNGMAGVAFVFLEETASDNLVGGTTSAARNVIAGNTLSGVGLFAGTTRTLVQGNYIGVDASGERALGNTLNGVFAEGGQGNTIGGSAQGAGNVISGNGAPNLLLWKNAADTLVLGNRIGPSASGASGIANPAAGVRVALGALDNRIGGVGPGEGNVIAFNARGGVTMTDGRGISVRGNSIFENGLLGIDLDFDGPTPNDPGDGDSGSNDRQNAPTILEATTDGETTRIRGLVESVPNRSYAVDVFAADECDSYGTGQGRLFLGTQTVATDASGSGAFEVVVSTALPIGQVVTATGTSELGNTSEFSFCVRVALAWDAPEAASPANPFPPPRNLRIDGASSVVTAAASAGLQGSVAGYNVYRSKTTPVAATPANLFASLPPSQTTVPVDTLPSGSFFVVTAVYAGGESPGSNEAEGGAAPDVDPATLKVTSKKLSIAGSGLSTGEILVFVDGIPFVQAAKVKRGGTTVLQKGALLTGTTVLQYAATQPPDQALGVVRVLIGFRGRSGGIVTVPYSP